MLTAVALDHAGALGVPERTVTAGRAAGIVLVSVGAPMVRKF